WVKSGHSQDNRQCPLYPRKRTFVGGVVMSALCQKQTFRAAAREHFQKAALNYNEHVRYSITSSALASSDCGTVSPSAFVVLRLMTSSYLVGACTGMSAGFSPLRMRSA